MRSVVNRWARWPLQIVLITLLVQPVWAAPAWQGVVVDVVDGDTLKVRRFKTFELVTVRMQGIDAPEACQSWGLKSKTGMALRLQYRTVTVEPNGLDKYDRMLATVYENGQNINAWAVQNGLAWSYVWKGHSPYAQEESLARQKRQGLFAYNAQAPWTFRRKHGPCHSGF